MAELLRLSAIERTLQQLNSPTRTPLQLPRELGNLALQTHLQCHPHGLHCHDGMEVALLVLL